MTRLQSIFFVIFGCDLAARKFMKVCMGYGKKVKQYFEALWSEEIKTSPKKIRLARILDIKVLVRSITFYLFADTLVNKIFIF